MSRFLSSLPDRVTVFEVGPRDGLQNESIIIPSEAKIRFINELADAGLTWIEATSFVHPKAVPQLADAGEVMAGIERRAGVRYPALVPNERGMERALESGVDAICVFTAASEKFSQANVRATIDETFERFEPVVTLAMEHDVWVRGYVSMAFHCPYEGRIAPEKALDVSARLLDLGVDEVAISDTVGRAKPRDMDDVLTLAVDRLPVEKLALHLHDTYDLALPNVMLGLEAGITVFDGAAGGLGGCPFAPGAPGNLATEKLVHLLHGLGIETGIDEEKVAAAAERIRLHQSSVV
ncbi:hydroxymethylglutaryl-CoA lyase [soil metagenome]